MILTMLIWLYLDIKPVVATLFLLACSVLFQVKRKIIPLFILFIPASANAQEIQLHYKLLHNDQQVGELRFEKLDSGRFTFYHMSMDVKMKLVLFSVKLIDRKTARYEKDILQYAVTERILKDKAMSRKETLKNENGYSDGTLQIPLSKSELSFSVLKLFTREPVGCPDIYSEAGHVELKVRLIDPHHYRVTTPEGNTNDYYYKEGVCYKIVTVTNWATVTALLDQTRIGDFSDKVTLTRR